MADGGDIAQRLAQQQRDHALRRRKPEGPQPTGYCLDCGESLEPPRRWCDFECMRDYCDRYGL